MINVYLLGHKAHAGKDTLADHLVKEHNFINFAFATKLKEVVADLYNFTDDQMYGSLKNVVDDRYNLTPREILQDFGQEQRSRFPDIWADYVCRQIQSHFDPNDTTIDYFGGVVITDFRFPNEFNVTARYAKKLGFNLTTVKIHRDDAHRGNFAGSQNISETALDDFPFQYVIENNGEISEMFQTFENLFLTNDMGWIRSN